MGMMVYLFFRDFDTQACPISLWSYYLLGLGVVGWAGFGDGIGLTCFVFLFFFIFVMAVGDVPW